MKTFSGWQSQRVLAIAAVCLGMMGCAPSQSELERAVRIVLPDAVPWRILALCTSFDSPEASKRCRYASLHQVEIHEIRVVEVGDTDREQVGGLWHTVCQAKVYVDLACIEQGHRHSIKGQATLDFGKSSDGWYLADHY